MVVRRIGVRQVPADRRQVPHERICDDLRRIDEDPVPLADQRVRLEVGLADERADAELAVLGDATEARDPVQVDEERGGRQTEAHERDEALSSGEQLRFTAGLREELDRVRQVLRDHVLEGSRDHRWASPSDAPAARNVRSPGGTEQV